MAINIALILIILVIAIVGGLAVAGMFFVVKLYLGERKARNQMRTKEGVFENRTTPDKREANLPKPEPRMIPVGKSLGKKNILKISGIAVLLLGIVFLLINSIILGLFFGLLGIVVLLVGVFTKKKKAEVIPERRLEIPTPPQDLEGNKKSLMNKYNSIYDSYNKIYAENSSDPRLFNMYKELVEIKEKLEGKK